MRSTPTIITTTPIDRNAILSSFLRNGICKSYIIQVGIRRTRISVASTMPIIPARNRTLSRHVPGMDLSQNLL
jgi:hypothetical protein